VHTHLGLSLINTAFRAAARSSKRGRRVRGRGRRKLPDTVVGPAPPSATSLAWFVGRCLLGLPGRAGHSRDHGPPSARYPARPPDRV